MEGLMLFLSTNWISIAIVIMFVVAAIYMWQKGYKKQVSLYILTLIAKAEVQFEHGQNHEKLMSVLNGIYEAFPKVLKFFYSKQDMIVIINNMVADTKEWLQNQSK